MAAPHQQVTIVDMFQFVWRLFGSSGSVKLNYHKEEVEQHLRQTHNDFRRGVYLTENDKQVDPEKQTLSFEESKPKLREVQDIIKKARVVSGPGPNGLPYKVYL